MSIFHEQMVKDRKGRRRPSFLDSAMKVEAFGDILMACQEPISFSQLSMTSKIKYKPTFLNYLKWSQSYGFLVKEKDKDHRQKVIYHITSKGRQFLEMFEYV